MIHNHPPSDEAIWDLNWSSVMMLPDSMVHPPQLQLNPNLSFPVWRPFVQFGPSGRTWIVFDGTRVAAGRVAWSVCRGNATILTGTIRACGISFQ